MSESKAERTIPGPSGSSSVTVSGNQFAQLMAAIESSQSRMDEKLAQFQEEIRQGQEDAASRALKWARYDKPYVFKKRGNEEQASFNAKVDEALVQAESDLSVVEHTLASTSTLTAAIQHIKKAIQKGHSLLEERQKLIRLANCSEYWNETNTGRLLIQTILCDGVYIALFPDSTQLLLAVHWGRLVYVYFIMSARAMNTIVRVVRIGF